MTRRLVPLAVIVAITNVVLLASARLNRLGNPEAIVRLTEREMPVVWLRSVRNSAQELTLLPATAENKWLDEPKLAALGFDTRVPQNPTMAQLFFRRQLSRRVFGVFELEGPAWTQKVRDLDVRRAATIARAESNETQYQLQSIDRQMEMDSRLFAIDASTDAAALRASYADRTRYLILPSSVQVSPIGNESAGPPIIRLSGQMRLVTSRIVVPVHARKILDPLTTAEASSVGRGRAPRYTVSLAVGHRLEPWIVRIDSIDTSAPRH